MTAKDLQDAPLALDLEPMLAKHQEALAAIIEKSLVEQITARCGFLPTREQIAAGLHRLSRMDGEWMEYTWEGKTVLRVERVYNDFSYGHRVTVFRVPGKQGGPPA